MHTPTPLILHIIALSLGICALSQCQGSILLVRPALCQHMELDHDHLFTGNHELWDVCSIHLHLSEEGLAGNGWILMQHVLLETYYLLFQKHQGRFTNVAQHSCLTTEKIPIIKILAIQHDFVKPCCLLELLNVVPPGDAGGTMGVQYF